MASSLDSTRYLQSVKALKQSDDRLEESLRWCRQVCRQSGSSFFRSFSLLTAERRQAMYALYAYARITDDLGDAPQLPCDQPLESGDWSHTERESSARQVKQQLLAAWRVQLRRQLAGAVEGYRFPDCFDPASGIKSLPERSLCESPVLLNHTDLSTIADLEKYALLWPSLKQAVERFEIPVQLLDDIAVGVQMDLNHRQPETWAALSQYCYHVAATVGLACTYIWNAGDEMPIECAIDCGEAFQLTNMLRDLREDAAVGRIYLPRDAFEHYRITPSRWLRGDPDGDWRGLVEYTAERAIQKYRSGWQTIGSLSPDGKRMFSLMWHTYYHLLHEILRQRDRIWCSQRIALPRFSQLKLLVRHLLPGCLPVPSGLGAGYSAG